MTTIVRLYTPGDWSGKLIAWRLESQYCHATIEINGVVYSATVPKVAAFAPTDPTVAQPPRGGQSYTLTLTEDQEAKALAYCKRMVGTSYDLFSILGWAFRLRWMQRPNHVYCFEYVYDALAAAGVFSTSKRLVSGDELLVDLLRANVIAHDRSGLCGLQLCESTPTVVRKPGFCVAAPTV